MPRSASFTLKIRAIHLRQLDRNSRVDGLLPFVVANENVFFNLGISPAMFRNLICRALSFRLDEIPARKDI